MIIGHQKQWQFLKQSAKSGRFSHAYLFSGPEKIGKKTIAFEFIKLINGEDILKREHSDLILVEPIGQEIRIPQIRELSWRLSLKPYSAPVKVAIIDQAHCLNQEAQNSLLKTLEEPKGSALLILITEAPETLFPTVLSRCERIKFYPVKRSEIEEYLKSQGILPPELEEITKIAMGRPGIAVELACSPQKIEEKKQVIKELIKISKADLFFRFQYAKTISSDPLYLKEVLGIWLNYFRNALLSQVSGGEGFEDYPVAKIKRVLNLIQSTNFLISTTNVNSRLALEILLMEL